MSTPLQLIRSRLEELAGRCVHCGFCLPACPTYAVTQAEADSPRGRILLVADEARRRDGGHVRAGVRRHIDRCIGCEACVPACPSGVRYDEIVHLARQLVDHGRPLPALAWRRGLASWFPSTQRSAVGIDLARRLGRTRRWQVRRTQLGRRLDAALQQARAADAARPGVRQQPRGSGDRGRVVLLAGCVAAAALPTTNVDARLVLEAEGYAVEELAGVCCGALAAHTGAEGAARRHAVRLARALSTFGERAPLVVTSAGCGAHLRRLGQLFEDGELAQVGARVLDVTELLAANPARAPRGVVSARVALHDACHHRFAQGIVEAPRALLASVPGLELVEVGGPNCCGAGGLYGLLEPELAQLVGRAKAEAIRATGARIVASANPGCTLQLRQLLGDGVEVVHPVTLVARSLAVSQTSAGS